MVYLMMQSVAVMIWHLMVRRLMNDELETFKVCYITMLSAASLHRMINECGAVGAMRTGKKTQITQRKPAPVPYSSL